MEQYAAFLIADRLTKAVRDHRGAAGIEYIILATLVAVVLAVAAPGIIASVTATVTTIAGAV